MNKDLVLKKGDRVEYKSHEQIKKLYVNELNGCTVKQFESNGVRKVLKVEQLVKYETIYELKDILDEKEKEYLSSVIRPFRDRVECVVKCEYFDDKQNWININLTKKRRYIATIFL